MKNMILKMAGSEGIKYLGAMALLLGLMLFSQGAMAQAAATFNPQQPQAPTNVKPTNGQPINFGSLVTSDAAMLLLKNAAQGLQAQTPSTARQEAQNSIKIAYYGYLLHLLGEGFLIDQVLPGSYAQVDKINARFNATYRLKPADLLQETAVLLAL